MATFVAGIFVAFLAGAGIGFGACIWFMNDEPDPIAEDD